MKTIIREEINLYIEKEMVEGRRFEYWVRVYKVVNDEIVELYYDPMVEE